MRRTKFTTFIHIALALAAITIFANAAIVTEDDLPPITPTAVWQQGGDDDSADDAKHYRIHLPAPINTDLLNPEIIYPDQGNKLSSILYEYCTQANGYFTSRLIV